MHAGSYTILDLPLINVLQGYFLSKALGESKVTLYGEPKQEGTVVHVMPTYAINTMNRKDIDVLINENSMPEMPEQSVVDYVQWARNSVRGVFYSYNQEACTIVNGIPPVLVPEIVARVEGFRRLSRNISWLRSGYVEEVYIPKF